MATQEGLRAALGFPIKLADEVVGVMECFSLEPKEPDNDFLEIVGSIGAQLGQFMERKRAEEALRNSEAQLHAVTKVTPVMLAQCSRDLRYLFVNRAYAEMLSLKPEEIIGRPMVDIVGAKAYAAIRPYVEKVLTGVPVEYEEDVPLRRVGSRALRVVYMPDTDGQGNVRGWVASISDITERKRAEAALQRAKDDLARANQDLERRVQQRTAELQLANAALSREREEEKRLEQQLRQSQKLESIGTLAGGIAHDFNNILNIIKGYASLLRQRGRRDDEVTESLEVIDETIERGASIVRQLLAVAKESAITFERVDLNDVVQQLKLLLSGTFPRTIDINMNLDSSLPAVLADANQMNQVLLNICVNARDAMPNGGELLLTTETIAGADLQAQFPNAKQTPYACVTSKTRGWAWTTLSRAASSSRFLRLKSKAREPGSAFPSPMES
jgi:PAS domain S-box-containing protein